MGWLDFLTLTTMMLLQTFVAETFEENERLVIISTSHSVTIAPSDLPFILMACLPSSKGRRSMRLFKRKMNASAAYCP